MPKDSTRTHVETFDTAKYFIIPVETLFKDLTFLFIRQRKLWNDMQLDCYGNSLQLILCCKQTVFWCCGLIKNIEHNASSEILFKLKNFWLSYVKIS